MVFIKCMDEGNENCGHRDDCACCYNGCDNDTCKVKCDVDCVNNEGAVN